MRTDRFSTPCPPEVLLSAYEVEPDAGCATGVTAAQSVADLTVLDGYLCAATRRAAVRGAAIPGATPTLAAVGGDMS